MRTLALLLAAFTFLLVRPSWAQRERFVPAPAGIQKTMKPRGISLAYLRLPPDSAGKEAWAHLYVAPPKNVFPKGVPEYKTFTRAYFIESYGASTPIPFYLDIFTLSGKTLQRRTSIVFQHLICPIDVRAHWLEPDKKRGLVLMLDFMIGNSGTWHVIPLDDHYQPISRQQFYYAFDTAEPDYNTSFSYSQTNTRGFLKLGTIVSEGEKKSAVWYEWQGGSFVDPLASYFVVAATHKTRKAAAAFVAKWSLQEYEIVSTDEHKEYTGLPPHSYLVVVTRFRGDKPVSEYEKQYPKYRVLKAF